MSTINDGGPAFPATQDNGANQGGVSGMSLRDYFAAKAMQAVMSTPMIAPVGGSDPVANLAYSMADAMLKAREQKCA